MKWVLVVAGLADLNRPAEDVSLPQSAALASTGLIWARYSTQIIPVNYNLLAVNFFVGVTGIYQLQKKLRSVSQALTLSHTNLHLRWMQDKKA